MLKFWSLVYRLTGWYSPWAELAEYRMLKTKWKDIEEAYRHPENDMHFKDLISFEIGMWQMHNKFYRKFKI